MATQNRTSENELRLSEPMRVLNGRRKKSGERQFQIRSNVYGDIWVSASYANLLFPLLVIDYYESLRQDENCVLLSEESQEGLELVGFAQGFVPDQILVKGKFQNGGRFFLMKWENSYEPSIVNEVEAKKICPDKVIEFYESLVVFQSQEE